MKLDLPHLLDWFDDRVLRHRFHLVCELVARLWPDDGEVCDCRYCRGFR